MISLGNYDLQIRRLRVREVKRQAQDCPLGRGLKASLSHLQLNRAGLAKSQSGWARGRSVWGPGSCEEHCLRKLDKPGGLARGEKRAGGQLPLRGPALYSGDVETALCPVGTREL